MASAGSLESRAWTSKFGHPQVFVLERAHGETVERQEEMPQKPVVPIPSSVREPTPGTRPVSEWVFRYIQA